MRCAPSSRKAFNKGVEGETLQMGHRAGRNVMLHHLCMRHTAHGQVAVLYNCLLMTCLSAGLLGEGAVQVLYSTDEYKQDPILAAVGQLQFEVRLQPCLAKGVNLFSIAADAVPLELPCRLSSTA